MILSILKSSLSFSMSYDCVTITVTCVTITSYLLSKSKIKKDKKTKFIIHNSDKAIFYLLSSLI